MKNRNVYILGISAFYPDSAAALIKNGEVIAAAQEERFTRKKHDGSFPDRSIRYCLKEAHIPMDRVDIVSFHGVSQKNISQKFIREKLEYKGKIIFIEHHKSHAASAFYPSPFDKAAVIVADDTIGDISTCFGRGDGNTLDLYREVPSPHSLGLLYSAFTYYAGFNVNSDEYKIMGLAPYGEPKFTDLILDELIDLKNDGTFKINTDYFNAEGIHALTNEKFDQLFCGPRRYPGERLHEKHMDLARSVQVVAESVMMKMAKCVHQDTGLSNLCLAGCVALNCVANGKMLKRGPFKNVWIQPASSDAGGALGAALVAWYECLGSSREKKEAKDDQKASLLGPSFSDEEIETYLGENDIAYERLRHEDMIRSVSSLLAKQNVVGWFQGRMEFGPRALGSRSILADPRCRDMQSVINEKIKFRESFRPFAPSVLLEEAKEYFEIDHESPYMLFAVPVKEDKKENTAVNSKIKGLSKLRIKRSEIAAVTHVDYSARVQTVSKEDNSLFHELIRRFYEDHGCPVLVNTSFNVKGEPIVCTPEDAYRCFMKTEMDYLVMGSFLIEKKDNNIKCAEKEESGICEYC
jgi:carbamoyltransferase